MNYYKVKAKLNYKDLNGTTHNITSFDQGDLDNLRDDFIDYTIVPNITLTLDWIGELELDVNNRYYYVIKTMNTIDPSKIIGLETNIREEWLTWEAGIVESSEVI